MIDYSVLTRILGADRNAGRAAGMPLYSTDTIAPDLIVAVTGDLTTAAGHGLLSTTLATNASALHARVPLMVADLVTNRTGLGYYEFRGVPWKRVYDVDTSAGAIGNPVYLGTAGGWSLSSAGTGVIVGVVTRANATTGAILLYPSFFASVGAGSGGFRSVMTAASAALTGSSTKTALRTVTIPASTLLAGTKVNIDYYGRATNTVGTTTLRTWLEISDGVTTVDLAASDLIDVANDDIFRGEFQLTSRAAPSAASAITGHGTFMDPGPVGDGMRAAGLVPTNFVTNGAITIKVFAKWSAIDASSCRLEAMEVSTES